MSLVVSPSSAQWTEYALVGVVSGPTYLAFLMLNGDDTYSITFDVTTTPIFELQPDNTVQVVA